MNGSSRAEEQDCELGNGVHLVFCEAGFRKVMEGSGEA